VGGGTRGFLPGGCGGFKVDVDRLESIDDIVPLGFLVSAGGTGLHEEDTKVVCVGCGEELDALVLAGSFRAGAFPFDAGGVAI